MDEIKRFRQIHSKTSGHPEYNITEGVEATTGPLGQGVGNAVGQALGLKMLGAQCSMRLALQKRFTRSLNADSIS